MKTLKEFMNEKITLKVGDKIKVADLGGFSDRFSGKKGVISSIDGKIITVKLNTFKNKKFEFSADELIK